MARMTLSIPGHDPDAVRKQLDERSRAAPPAPAAQTVQKDAMVRAVTMLLDEEREQTDALFAELRKDVDAAKDIAERTTDKALKSLIDRLDRYADRASDIEAARKTTEQRVRDLSESVNAKLRTAENAHKALAAKQAELDQRVKDVAIDNQSRQIVPQLLQRNMDNLRSVLEAIKYGKADTVHELQLSAPEGWL